jgi:hypothetical protein
LSFFLDFDFDFAFDLNDFCLKSGEFDRDESEDMRDSDGELERDLLERELFEPDRD